MALSESYVPNKIVGASDKTYIAWIPWVSSAQGCAKHSGCWVFLDYPIITAK